MKTRGLIMLALVAILLLSSIAAGCVGTSGVTKPTVGYIPPNWELSIEESYGYFEETDGTKWGVIDYLDAEDSDSVQIYYGDVPPELKGKENDGAALIERAILESVTFDPAETGTITIAGHLAGYTKGYDSSSNYYEMEIVFVHGTTCIDIYAVYDATTEDEDQVMSLINSISF